MNHFYLLEAKEGKYLHVALSRFLCVNRCFLIREIVAPLMEGFQLLPWPGGTAYCQRKNGAGDSSLTHNVK